MTRTASSPSRRACRWPKPKTCQSVHAATMSPSTDRVSAGVGDGAVAQVTVELALDPLQCVVDRLHVPVEHLGDLDVALAVDVEPQHLGLEVAQRLVEV